MLLYLSNNYCCIAEKTITLMYKNRYLLFLLRKVRKNVQIYVHSILKTVSFSSFSSFFPFLFPMQKCSLCVYELSLFLFSFFFSQLQTILFSSILSFFLNLFSTLFITCKNSFSFIIITVVSLYIYIISRKKHILSH